MIVLDTNQVDSLGSPHGALSVMLSQIAARSGHKLALPEMVLTEHLAHYEHKVEQAISAASTALATLGSLDAQPRAEKSLPSIAASVAKRKSVMQEQFTILDAPADAAREALAREARRKRPADTAWDAKGAGARDVVVWLTVLHAAAQPGANVHFVSSDRDFTDRNGELHPELRREAEEREVAAGSLTVHQSVSSLLETFAQKVELPTDFDPNDVSWLDVIFLVEAAVRSGGLEAVRFWQDQGKPVEVVANVREIHAAKRGKVHAYQLDDAQWISAECRWTGMVEVSISVNSGPAQATTPQMSQQVPFTFDGTCLASQGPDGALLNLTTLLSSTWVRFNETPIHVQRPWYYRAHPPEGG